MQLIRWIFLGLLWIGPLSCFCQEDVTVADKVLDFPGKFFNRVRKGAGDMNEKLTAQSVKTLESMAKRETKLKKKLSKVDSTKASALFNGSETEYSKLLQKLKSNDVPVGTGHSGEYLAELDSLHTGLSFLNNNQKLLSSSKEVKELTEAFGNVRELQAKFNTAGEVQQFISQREQLLKSQLSQYGFGKELAALNAQAYYYQAQLAEYKNMLHDKEKMKAKAFSELNKIPAYQHFVQKNSYLAQLFGLPSNYGSAESLDGLQTKDMVKNLINSKGGGGSGPSSLNSSDENSGSLPSMDQELSSARKELSGLQDKLAKLGIPVGNSGSLVMPDFKPNGEKEKTFLNRLEYGFDIQVQRSGNIVPSIMAMALKLGYKINDKSSVGLGMSYNLGLGNGINHIALSSQGVGLRSYVDVQLKGSIWFSGGFEYNYLKAFSKITTLYQIDNWQKSCLFGLSKKYKMTSKKTGYIQLLFDALYQQHYPATSPIVFRSGFQF